MPVFPEIPYERFEATGQSLHMWSQIVGKFRLAQTPWLNHSWHATLYVNARGLTTGPVPVGERSFEICFDFLGNELIVMASDGQRDVMSLRPMSVAEFDRWFRETLTRMGAPVNFHGVPNEVPNPVPFAKQVEPGSYDPDAAREFYRALVAIEQVFVKFRTGFLGKVSPAHLFWGSFDFAITRFSGAVAPPHPGGIPALPDEITREAYSHQVSSAGFWPGAGLGYPAFYSYAYPVPEGFEAAIVAPGTAVFDKALGEFILAYDDVRTSDNPEQTLLDFLISTYEAAANLGAWDRDALECPIAKAGKPRVL